ncbi:MAG: hypothetical protein SO471_14185 [Anaerobutyricum hallii]|uniref:hypothetical protein n=1 Tax=Anaerobutyricum hallii TaxID=39488 RepID=UPI002A8325E2|nr:hypothetical protein [Anaerobutyricum hallii]MDY4579064.1 hypothetical protein [Anaerobutyricum hallii]
MIVNCKNCGKKVEYELTGPVYPGGKDREEAVCPYCHYVLESRMTSQCYYVKGLEDEKETNK